MAVGTDLASERIKLQDLSARRPSDGARIVRVLPWQIVTYSGVCGLEPLDWVRGGTGSLGSEKELTGIQSMEGDKLFVSTNCGGAVDFPET